jgi:hypothetical protein
MQNENFQNWNFTALVAEITVCVVTQFGIWEFVSQVEVIVHGIQPSRQGLCRFQCNPKITTWNLNTIDIQSEYTVCHLYKAFGIGVFFKKL